MTITVLIDLDDTLLANKMESFLPKYLGGLKQYLDQFNPAVDVPTAVLEGTRQMLLNNDPGKTLEESFDEVFYQKIGISKKDLFAAIQYFYEQIFPLFSNLTKAIPEAKALISALRKKNVSLVIATNPLFPKTAIIHRIHWADLGVPLEEYSLITSYEDFHFAKPNPAYYAEILAHLGWPDGAIVMVGNDLEMDIIPAENIGLQTFFLETSTLDKSPDREAVKNHGNWAALDQFLSDRIHSKDQSEITASKDALIACLSGTAAYIDHLRRKQVKDAFWKTRPDPKEWSLIEIISHLADVDAEVNLPRVQIIKQQQTPFFAAIETDQWAEERSYIQNDPLTTLKKFIDNRKALIAEFSTLTAMDHQKSIQHSIFGPTSVTEIFKFIVQHDRIHLNQIHQVIQALPTHN